MTTSIKKRLQEARRRGDGILDLSGRTQSVEDRLETIPEMLLKMEGIAGIDLSNNRLRELPTEWLGLREVQFLDLSGNRLQEFPLESLRSLTKLRTLIIDRNEFRVIPSEIAQLPLTSLCLGGALTLPSALADLPLQQLRLQFCGLEKLPPWLSSMASLKSLDLHGNRLGGDALDHLHLPGLVHLDLSDNPLKYVSKAISRFPLVKNLWLYMTGIAELPSEVATLQDLENLILWNNRFTEFPEVLRNLRRLRRIDFSNTKTRIKERHNNEIQSVPAWVADLPHLEILDLDGNPIRTPPPEIAARGIGAIREYFAQLADSGEDYLFEAKLLILGEAGAGKTSLAAKLIDPRYVLQPDEVSTEGIAVRQWNFAAGSQRTFTVNIWDFGGQEIYHATHQFFLTKRSLYLLVADNRKEDTDFYYWLKVIELLGGNSPILIIKNEKQDRHREIDQRALMTSFEALRQVRVVNLATNRGVSDTIKAIKQCIAELPHIGTPLPSKWVKVRQALEAHPANFIDMEEYRRICAQHGFSSSDDASRLSDYLHDLGVCLHFQQDPLLKKILILKPKWGTDAVYRVLDNKEIIAAYGRFTRGDLASIWQEPEYETMRDELLQLMLNFRLCYKIPGTDDTHMAPQLLGVNQPDYAWDDLPQLILRYEYDFLPKGILTQLIVSMHTLIEHSTCVWRSGVVFSRAGARAEVVERYQARQIRVRVQGQNRKELLTIIAYELDKIHSAFKDLRYRMLIPCNCMWCQIRDTPNFYDFETLQKFRVDNQRLIQCQHSYEMVDVKELVDDVVDSAYGERKEQATHPAFVISGSGQTVIIGPQESQMKKSQSDTVRGGSAWANGSFYLFVFVIVLATLCVAAKTISFAALTAIVIAGIVIVPIIGALQLRQDDRLSEKPFIELMKLSLQQLPVIRRAGNSVKASQE